MDRSILIVGMSTFKMYFKIVFVKASSEKDKQTKEAFLKRFKIIYTSTATKVFTGETLLENQVYYCF